MCVVSMVLDHYQEKWRLNVSPHVSPLSTFTINPVSREEFEALKRDVEEMKALLIRAKEYDRRNNEPDCEMAEKVALIKKVAELVGVDISEVVK